MLAFTYDRFGRTLQEGELVHGDYDENGNARLLTYPGGLTAATTFDLLDRPATLAVNPGAGSVNLVSAAGYKAMGPLASLTLATTPARTEARGFDFRYQPTSVDVSGPLLHWDYTTDDIGNISAISQTQPTAESRSYGYQDFQYFLTSGSGPWPGPLAWEYDRIGNRTSETRSGITDTYSYTPNAGLPPGHTALLDAVALAGGSGGTRDYTFGPAGHLELLDAGANVLDFGNDVVGQLASVTRTAEHSASFRYDGRGFLREIVTLEPGSGGGGGDLPFLDGFETGDPCAWSAVVGYPGPACPIPPVETRTRVTYDSQGRLRALLPESGDPSYVFTFGDRPIATYTGGPMPSFTWLTTDHLGTPILAFGPRGVVSRRRRGGGRPASGPCWSRRPWRSAAPRRRAASGGCGERRGAGPSRCGSAPAGRRGWRTRGWS